MVILTACGDGYSVKTVERTLECNWADGDLRKRDSMKTMRRYMRHCMRSSLRRMLERTKLKARWLWKRNFGKCLEIRCPSGIHVVPTMVRFASVSTKKLARTMWKRTLERI